MEKIYLDNNSTTGVDPRVVEAMLEELSAAPSNPSSVHFFGRQAKMRLNQARQTIASFLKVKSEEIVFTSSGTEAMNLILSGFCYGKTGGHAISSNVEHSSVHQTLLHLKAQELDVSFLPAGLHGAVSPSQIKEAIRSDTRFISLIAVNNETGVKHDLDAIGQIALEAGIPLFIDGVAWLGKELFTLHPGIAAAGFSGHKIHGPKGTGFAFIRSAVKCHPLLIGGPQESSLRAGTENLAGIVGLAKAMDLLKTELPAATKRMQELRDRLELGLADIAMTNGTGPRICNISNLSFPGHLGEDLLIALDLAGVAISHGSACSSGALEPSRILTQMGLPPSIARSALRFSLSRTTTAEEIDAVIEVISHLTK
jgi:cysteine desulfurase